MTARKDSPHKTRHPTHLNEVIQKRLKYDPDTGKITWRNTVRSDLVGKEAGYINRHLNRRLLSVQKRIMYSAHVAWFLHYGEWPEHTIDHINRDTLDDRICNLRDVTQSENNYNRRHCGR